jgi:hypothetical protein
MKRSVMSGFLPGVLVALASAACGDPELESARQPFVADVVVTTDPGHGMLGAELVAGGRPQATTDADGHARLSLAGAEGDAVEIAVRCPPGFQSPPEAIAISLHRLAPGSRVPTFAARCAPLARTVVVGIRADNGANLPVTYLGKEVGRTDAWGAAHVVLSVKANETVTLALDTSSAGTKQARLRPESPTLSFVAQDKDDFVTLEQKFDVERPVVRLRAPAPRPGPTRI